MPHIVPLICGDGIGVEITSSLKSIFNAAEVPVIWDEVEVGRLALDKGEALFPSASIRKIQKYHCLLKGPLNTPAGQLSDLNAGLYEQLNLYVRLASFKTVTGVPSRYSGIDFTLISGLFADKDTELLIRKAFEYARQHQRKKITLVHHIQSGKEETLTLIRAALKVSSEYPEIILQDQTLEKACMHLVDKPERYEVIVSPAGLYGILAHLAMAMTGGSGLSACSIVGKEITIFEPVHGTAGDITGMGIANPVAMIKAGLLLLEHLQLKEHATRIEATLNKALADSASRTVDIDGTADTEKFTRKIIEQL